jgi:putative Holliday junction resolvase
LALDLGARRIGLAVSDPLGLTAQGLETLQRKNKRADLEHLAEVVHKYEVAEIVLGLPLHMSGDESAQSRRSTEFAEELKEKLRLPVHLWDERLTSAQANRLLRESEMSIRRRGQAVDRMAATLILQSFLESRSAKEK